MIKSLSHSHTHSRSHSFTLNSFKTLRPQVATPESFNVTLNKENNKLELSWSKVRCSTAYMIHQRLEGAKTETTWTYEEQSELFVSLDSPEPCATYR